MNHGSRSLPPSVVTAASEPPETTIQNHSLPIKPQETLETPGGVWHRSETN